MHASFGMATHMLQRQARGTLETLRREAPQYLPDELVRVTDVSSRYFCCWFQFSLTLQLLIPRHRLFTVSSRSLRLAGLTIWAQLYILISTLLHHFPSLSGNLKHTSFVHHIRTIKFKAYFHFFIVALEALLITRLKN